MIAAPDKALSTRARELVSRARSRLIIDQPFFGCLALQLQVEEGEPDYHCPTMATDGKKLLYWPKFVVEEITFAELVGVIAHEVLHVAYCHMVRRGNRDATLWNIACDAVINIDLKDAGFVLPKGGVDAPQYRGWTAEQVYTALEQMAPEARPQPCEWGEVQDACEPHEKGKAENIAEQIEAQVRVAIGVAKRAAASPGGGRGDIPAALEHLVKELGRARVSWRDEMRRFADLASTYDYTWSRPDRRFIGAGLILPGLISIAPAHVAIAIDTSGSMDDAALAQCLGELQAFLDEGAADMVTVCLCDTKVHSGRTYNAGEVIDKEVEGRGGTAFRPAFDWLQEHAPGASCIIYLTDGDGESDWGGDPGRPVLWALTDPSNLGEVPFGQAIVIDAHDR